MGFMGRDDDSKQATQAAVATSVGPCSGDHYLTEVNKGSINMRHWQKDLNDMHRKGYRLFQVFSQDGNTIQIFEHHWH